MVIFAISVVPVSGEGKPLFFSFPGADKVVHAGIYSILTILLMKDYFLNIHLQVERMVALLLSILVYSIIIEIIQASLTTYRSGELLDIVANLAGVLIGAAFILLYRKIKY